MKRKVNLAHNMPMSALCNAFVALDNNLKTNQFRSLHCVLPNAFIIIRFCAIYNLNG